ncbi:MAG: ATP-dependent helicase [Dissulfurispiraceae bacterium]|jgi:DNA helicase II / ATP-dependent DNA helicase PcrA
MPKASMASGGATHQNIMAFPDKFEGSRIIKLEENYRSAQAILDVANTVLENMKYKYSKCLVSTRKKQGIKPQLLFFRDPYEEAEWVADRIKKQMDEGIPLSHQCILFRSMYLSIAVQSELGKRNIPYETFGGLKFYETAHVKDLMAHFKVISNPKDELSWNRVLILIERVGAKTADSITEEIVKYTSLPEIMNHVLSKHAKKQSYGEGLSRLKLALDLAFDKKEDVGDKFEVILDYYRPILKERFDDWHLRLNDLEALRQIASRYSSLEELLEDFGIEPPERGVWRVEPETKKEEKPLVLSTIHSAKGLEWDCVFLMGLIDGVLPVTFSLDEEESIEEEHRLFYVAVTRAKNRLYLTLHHAGQRGGLTQFNKMSRFVDTPDILSKLDSRDVAKYAVSLEAEEATDMAKIYDKKTLLHKIMDSYK